ncbi:MAG: alpha/beta hydrolase family esterase [Petrotogales bacterium]
MDDVGYIVNLLSVIKERFSVDENRTYLIGFSNGGMISYKLISEHPELFAGAAIVSSSPSGGKNEESLVHIKPPKTVVPLVIFHGELDTIIPYYGGYSGEENETGIYFPSIPKSVKYWANTMGAHNVKKISLEDESVIFRKYLDISGSPIIEFYTLINEGHTFPGRLKGIQSVLQKSESTLSAKEIIWDFFERITSERFQQNF